MKYYTYIEQRRVFSSGGSFRPLFANTGFLKNTAPSHVTESDMWTKNADDAL
jgi:hypothetical protein